MQNDLIMGNSKFPKSFHSKNWSSISFVDDVNSFMYYGTFGLLDPKMPIEAVGYKKVLGLTGWRGLAVGAG